MDPYNALRQLNGDEYRALFDAGFIQVTPHYADRGPVERISIALVDGSRVFTLWFRDKKKSPILVISDPDLREVIKQSRAKNGGRDMELARECIDNAYAKIWGNYRRGP